MRVKTIKTIVLLSAYGLLLACSPIKNTVINQYQLDAFSVKKTKIKPTTAQSPYSVLISLPEAIPGYQSNHMLYKKKPHTLSHFAHNNWISSPANMLYPLIIQSIENSHYFFAVASGPDADKTDYRVDTQLIKLQQNFLKKPSVIEFVVKGVVTHIPDNQVVSSRMFTQIVACPQESPYGGVVAANQAAQAFTKHLLAFIISSVAHDHPPRG